MVIDDCKGTLTCKKCKKEFMPKKDELRCHRCLNQRKQGRIERRKNEREFNMFDSMVRYNGSHKRSKVSMFR